MIKPKLYIHSMTVVDDKSGDEYPITLEEMEISEKVFTCAGCGQVKPWSEGGADDMPDHCDSCWHKEHYPAVSTPISSEITYV